MKRLITTLTGIALLAACHEENLPTTPTDNTAGRVVTVTANLPAGGADSRVTLTPDTDDSGNPIVKVAWRDDEPKETFSVMTNAGNDIQTFTQTEGACFSGTLPDVDDGDTYYAFYPKVDGDAIIATKVPYDLSQQTGRPDETKTYMYATSTDGTRFDFRHLTAIVQFKFNGLPQGVKAMSATLQGDGLGVKGDVDLTGSSDEVTYSPVAPAENRIDITSPAENGMYVHLPPMQSGSVLRMLVNADNGKTYAGNLITAKEIVAGKIYTANVSLSEYVFLASSSLDANGLQTAVADALNGGVRDFTITGNLDEDRQKAVGTALRNWCGSNAGTGSDSNFAGRGTVTLTLPDVTEVYSETFGEISDDSYYAFSLALGALYLPNATIIGENGFFKQEYLREVHAPKVTTVNKGAFCECYELTTVEMPLLETVKDDAFLASSISTIPGNPVTIGYDAFRECDNLTEVNLTRATSIGSGAFRICANLQSVTAPLLTEVPLWAFADCGQLTSLTFAQPITQWGGQVLNSMTTENITLTLHPDQKVLTGSEANVQHSKWTPADGAPTVTFGENQEFCGYTFKEIKRYGE